MRKYNIAILGVNTIIGKELLKILLERNFPVNALRLLTSTSVGKRQMTFKEADYLINAVNNKSFRGVDIAFFLENNYRIKEYAQIAKEDGAIVIDACGNLKENVTLIVPEVNKNFLKNNSRIISSPSPEAVFLACALKPIFIRVGIKKVNAVCLHPVIEQGEEVQKELRLQTKDYLQGDLPPADIVSFYQAFNLIPFIGEHYKDGITTKENEIAEQLKKVIPEPRLKVTVTCIKVPIFKSATIFCLVETIKPMTKNELIIAFSTVDYLEIVDNPENLIYPTSLFAEDKDKVLIGRIRINRWDNELNFIITADIIRKGTALNLVQIAEELIKEKII